MIVVDLFAGAGGWSQAFRARGHDVTTVDNEEWFDPDICADVRELTAADLPKPHIVLASPPCEGFSVAAIRWNFRDGVPYGWKVKQGIELVHHTLRLVTELDPDYFVIENPRGMLAKMDLIPYEKRTITQCQYGREGQKPTDLWGGFPPSLKLKAACKRGDPCHRRQGRGEYHTYSLQSVPKWQRAMIPEKLSRAVCRAAERDLS